MNKKKHIIENILIESDALQELMRYANNVACKRGKPLTAMEQIELLERIDALTISLLDSVNNLKEVG